MDLTRIFNVISDQMRNDFEQARASFTHPGLKGNALENGFRSFLRKYLPKSLTVSQGILVDSNGNSSKQLDVIISDTLKTPIFYEDDTTRVIPIECAYAVIEIKSSLDINELGKIYANMLSVKDLEKKAFIQSTEGLEEYVMLYGSRWNIWPINYYVFSLDSISLSSCTEFMNKKNIELNLPVHKRIDSICVLNQGIITNLLQDGKFDGLPDQNSKLHFQQKKQALLAFYALTARYWFQVRMPVFEFIPYIKYATFD